mmetsp:Transcript_18428/g.27805  ORF Transcript_18428/g.27805 Transcript_18428/m.27805 type:complete len:273 (+) Transcript_18428:101-919(+)
MSALVRITTGIMAQHSRVGVSRAMAQFGEVVHCHKPPYSGIPGEDFVNVRFASQDAADRAYTALKAGQVFIDGFQVGVGPAPGGGGGGGKGGGGGGGDMMSIGNGVRRRSISPPRHFARNRQRSPGGGGGGRGRRSPPRRDRDRGDRDRGRGDSPQKANFPSRNDPKSPSPRRLAREMHISGRSRSRSGGRQYRRENRASDFGFTPGGGVANLGMMNMRLKDKVVPRARTPSPDPPGPVKNMNQVKNMFYKANRSPTPELYDPDMNTNYVAS